MESRHQFIYCENSKKNVDFLNRIIDNYSIKTNENSPMAIYMDEFSLPNIDCDLNHFDQTPLITLSREYLNFSIAYNIIKNILNQINLQTLNERIDVFISRINELFVNSNKILDLNDLLKSLETSRNFYKEQYIAYLKNGTLEGNINNLKISFLEISFFCKYVKKLINNNSFFGILINYQESMPLLSYQAINYYINRRINSDISIKVICGENDWKTYYDLSGNLIQSVHDYGVIKLDSNEKQYIKKI